MRNLRKFNSSKEYQEAEKNLCLPNVSYVKEVGGVFFRPSIYYDKSTKSLVVKTKNSSVEDKSCVLDKGNVINNVLVL